MKTPLLFAAAIGPVTLNLLGYDLPVLSALLSLGGVVLASLIAPPPERHLSRIQRVALVALLCLIVLGLVISDPTRSVIVSTCWSIGIGYTGLPLISEIQRRIFPRTGELLSPAPISAQEEQTDDQ